MNSTNDKAKQTVLILKSPRFWTPISRVSWEYFFPIVPALLIWIFKIALGDNSNFRYDILVSWCFVIATASIVHIEQLYARAWRRKGAHFDLLKPKLLFYAGVFVSFVSLTGGSLMLFLGPKINEKIFIVQLVVNGGLMSIIFCTYYISYSYADIEN